MYWGICPRVSGGQTQQRCTLLGPAALGKPGPSGAQVSLGDQSLKLFLSGEILPSVSQWFRQGLRWWVIVQRLWDQGELPHVQQHWSHTQVEICHGLVGAHLWLNFGVWKWHVCTPARTHTHTYMQRVDACALKKTCGSVCISKSVKVHTWELYLHLPMHLRMHASTQTCIYINNMTFSIKTKKKTQT